MIYTWLRSFHAVAQTGGFTAAAQAINVGQPTITSQVKSLEEYYSVELFHRRGRSVELTDAGQDLFVITRSFMSREEEARDLLSAYGGFQTGQLKVGAVGPYHATEMLSAFHNKYPELRLTVAIGNSREMVEQLINYSVDIGVLAHVEDDPRIFAMPYSRHPVVTFMQKEHPLAKRKSIRIEELEGQSVVLREHGSTTRLAFEEALTAAGVSIEPVMEIGSREAVWLAVARGIGIGVVSDIEFIPHRDLRCVPISNANIYTTAHVNCLAERKETRLIEAFFEVCRDLIISRPAIN
ncbi:MAG: LysR family transcriptional regulator [Alphaproteobacteria bacterium]|nr:LysR family transcriptional regulator [Alphaproteobacteria bacterium]